MLRLTTKNTDDLERKNQLHCLPQTPSMGTLLPCKEERVKLGYYRQSFYIEGDNLEVLKLLNKSYLNRIK